MNDRAARNRRYLRLLLEGFSEAVASQMVNLTQQRDEIPRLFLLRHSRALDR